MPLVRQARCFFLASGWYKGNPQGWLHPYDTTQPVQVWNDSDPLEPYPTAWVYGENVPFSYSLSEIENGDGYPWWLRFF